jgi:hypothetical protein
MSFHLHKVRRISCEFLQVILPFMVVEIDTVSLVSEKPCKKTLRKHYGGLTNFSYSPHVNIIHSMSYCRCKELLVGLKEYIIHNKSYWKDKQIVVFKEFLNY